jgi:hypothetical protein
MYKYIGIEELASNALIELLERENRRYVSFEKLHRFGMTIVQILSEKGNGAILTMDLAGRNNLIHDYSDFFEIAERKGKESIILKDEKTAEDLRLRFRAYMGIDTLLACLDKEALKALGIEIGVSIEANA